MNAEANILIEMLIFFIFIPYLGYIAVVANYGNLILITL